MQISIRFFFCVDLAPPLTLPRCIRNSSEFHRIGRFIFHALDVNKCANEMHFTNYARKLRDIFTVNFLFSLFISLHFVRPSTRWLKCVSFAVAVRTELTQFTSLVRSFCGFPFRTTLTRWLTANKNSEFQLKYLPFCIWKTQHENMQKTAVCILHFHQSHQWKRRWITSSRCACVQRTAWTRSHSPKE